MYKKQIIEETKEGNLLDKKWKCFERLDWKIEGYLTKEILDLVAGKIVAFQDWEDLSEGVEDDLVVCNLMVDGLTLINTTSIKEWYQIEYHKYHKLQGKNITKVYKDGDLVVIRIDNFKDIELTRIDFLSFIVE